MQNGGGVWGEGGSTSKAKRSLRGLSHNTMRKKFQKKKVRVLRLILERKNKDTELNSDKEYLTVCFQIGAGCQEKEQKSYETEVKRRSGGKNLVPPNGDQLLTL